jgi:hypothetical protein
MPARIASSVRPAFDNIISWLTREPWREPFRAYILPFLNRIPERQDPMTGGVHESWFNTFMDGLAESFCEKTFDDAPNNVVEDYLKRRGWKETATGREYLQKIRSSSFSLYTVQAIKIGESITVRDTILPSIQLEVSEVKGSQSIQAGEYVLAKIVHMNGVDYFTGALLRISPTHAVDLVLEIQDQLEQMGLSGENPSHAAAIRQQMPSFYPALFIAAIHTVLQPLPTMRNRDGHDYLFTEIRFPVKDRETVIAVLNSWDDLEQEEESHRWVWVDPLSSSPNALTILGHLDLTARWLKGQTNSKERGQLLQQRLSESLPEALGQPLATHQSLESAWQEMGDTPFSDSGHITDPEILADVMLPLLDAHYRKLINESIPMLKDQTPKEAVKTTSGRRRAIQWLTHLETNHERGGDSMPGYDFTWMWQELGLSRLEL